MSAEYTFDSGGYAEPIQPLTDVHAEPDQVYPLAGYDQLDIFRNPYGSRADVDLEPLDALKATAAAYECDTFEHHTSQHLQENINALQEHVTAGSLVVVRAGDGGVSGMLSAMRAAQLENPVLVMPGGNKNDIATALQTPELLEHPEGALLCPVCTVRPIVVSFGPEGEEPITLDAYGYASVGISGLVAARVNDPNYRQSRLHHLPGGRWLAEGWLAARTFVQAKPFTITGSDGESQPTLDLILANGNQMAGNLHPAANLLEPGLRLIHARRKLGALATIGNMMLGRPTGEAVDADERRELILNIPTGRETYLQVDGEQHRLVGRVVLSFQVAPTGVNVLSLAT